MGGSLGGDPGANYLEHCGGFSWALYEGLFGLDLGFGNFGRNFGNPPDFCNLMTKQNNSSKHKNNLPSQNWCAEAENVCVPLRGRSEDGSGPFWESRFHVFTEGSGLPMHEQQTYHASPF